MSETPIVRAAGVTKVYARRGVFSLLLRREGRRAIDVAPDARRTVALDDVSFTVARGSSLAIIGRNGAGKSTLLRMLAGVSKPTSGRIQIHGTLRSLLELGAGLLDDASGRANAEAVLALDGITGSERAQRTEEALEFADLGRFADEPLRTYSSGMRLRLAYALAIAVRPEVLVADEILAVGDEAFQRRCSRHVVTFLAEGGTLVLATHNLYHVEKLCRDAIWLEGGRVMAYGPAREVTAAYRTAIDVAAAAGDAAIGAGAIGVTTVGASAMSTPAMGTPSTGPGTTTDVARPSAESEVRRQGALVVGTARSASARRIVEGEDLEIALPAVAASSRDDRVEIERVGGACVASFAVAGSRIVIPRCPLLPGRYRARLVRASGAPATASAEAEFDCVGTSRELGTIRLEHRWH